MAWGVVVRDDLAEVGMAAVDSAKVQRPTEVQEVTMTEADITIVAATTEDVQVVATVIAAAPAVAIMEGSVVR